ncbi:MAG TPA: MFS transporter [Casimicrobiaceae bacterium]|nr:MFS transporter [Casimicrobiaceae bacterium]
MRASPSTWVAVALLWLAGNALRLTILAVPPVIAMIRDDLSLSATQVGLLSSIAPALFAIAALGGSLLVAYLGARGALIGGLLVIAAGSALRGLSPGYAVLLATTVLMSVGVAIMQPIMPTTVRQWLPHRIGLGTAIYTNGLLVGEVFPTLLTIPLVLSLLGGSWRLSLVFWSVPIATGVDKGFEWLERAYARRDPGATYVLTDLFFRPLHGDSRWQAFLLKMGLGRERLSLGCAAHNM